MPSNKGEPLRLNQRLPKEYDKMVISMRIKPEFVERIDELAKKTQYSRNQLLCMMIEYGLKNIELDPSIERNDNTSE